MRYGALLATAIVAGLVACVPSLRVRTDYDPEGEFERIVTFHSTVATGWHNDLAERRVQRAIDSALVAHGWRKAESAESADAIVAIHGATEMRRSITTFYDDPMWHGWWWRGWRFWGPPRPTVVVRDFRVGSLVVDIFDARTKHVVWRGEADGELADQRADRREQVHDALSRMFRDFPPAVRPPS